MSWLVQIKSWQKHEILFVKAKFQLKSPISQSFICFLSNRKSQKRKKEKITEVKGGLTHCE